MPALVLNYFGQGALLLADPAAIKNPFYLLAPQWALLPLVILATCAAVIASQAVISRRVLADPRRRSRWATARGSRSCTRPSARSARSTCRSSTGRCSSRSSLLVLGFRSSDNLAGAYGIAVTLAMLIDSVLIFVVMRRLWQLVAAGSRSRSPCRCSLIDLAFLASNSLKIPDGGWFPLADRRASCSRCSRRGSAAARC